VGDKSKQTLVLVHGYGGSGAMFWKIIKALSENYHLLLIDILGMGGSCRVPFPFKKAE
jgi:pimeloyl-ACP methyl ester carboxylesterase